jgi:hypothetical protein
MLARDAERRLPGRDAIRRSFGDAIKLGLHDYSVQRTISRREGTFVFNAGTWQAKGGGLAVSRLLFVHPGEQSGIIEETVVVAAP